MTKQKLTTFAWGAVAGAIVISIVLFSTGWAVTMKTAEQNARVMSESAVAENLAKICVAQFATASDRADKLAEMKELDSWQRGNYVNQHGWATMPGSDSATSQVATECASLLLNAQG